MLSASVFILLCAIYLSACQSSKPQYPVVDPVQWHDQHYLSMEDDFFKAIGVSKEDCEKEESENSILYTLPDKYMVYNEESRGYMATLYSEVRNLSFSFEFHDGLQRPFDLFKTIISEMDQHYERQDSIEKNALDTCEDVEAFATLCYQDLNLFGVVWNLDDDESVILEVRNSGDESYIVLTFKFINRGGIDGRVLFGEAYDAETAESIGEITSAALEKIDKQIILRFYYDDVYYYISFDANSGEPMEKGTKYEAQATLDNGTNCVALLITDDTLTSASGLVRCFEGDVEDNKAGLQFGFLLSESRDTLKDWLSELNTFMQQDGSQSQSVTETSAAE